MANDQKHLLVIARLIAGALIGGGDSPGRASHRRLREVPSEAEASVPVNRTGDDAIQRACELKQVQGQESSTQSMRFFA